MTTRSKTAHAREKEGNRDQNGEGQGDNLLIPDPDPAPHIEAGASRPPAPPVLQLTKGDLKAILDEAKKEWLAEIKETALHARRPPNAAAFGARTGFEAHEAISRADHYHGRRGIDEDLQEQSVREVNKLASEVRSLHQKLEKQERKNEPPVSNSRLRKSPFCDEIFFERLPLDKRLPTQLPRYFGTEDPDEHLASFNLQMQLHGISDNVAAKAFSTTLAGMAQSWFGRLEEKSIFDYDQLCDKFMSQFGSKRAIRPPASHLYSIIHKPGETFRDFMGRFNNELLKVEMPRVDFLITVLFQSTLNRGFASAIVRENPATYEKLMEMANQYMNEEEMNKLRGTFFGLTKPEEGHSSGIYDRPVQGQQLNRTYESRNRRVYREERNHNPGRQGLGRSNKEYYDNYTPLKKPRSEILFAIQDHNLLRKPAPIKDYPASKKYCRFHRQRGHDTDDCYQLRDEIERLIAEGHLTGYVKMSKNEQPGVRQKNCRLRSRSPAEREQRSKDREDQPRRAQPGTIVNMISGGPAGGDSKNSRKVVSRIMRNRAQNERREVFSIRPVQQF